MKKILLVGSDNSHLPIVQCVDQHGEKACSALWVTPCYPVDQLSNTFYQHQYQQNVYDMSIEDFVRRVNARLIVDDLVALDVERNTAVFQSGYKLNYDIISLDTGTETDTSQLAILGERLLPVKPVAQFLSHWRRLLKLSTTAKLLYLIVTGDDLSALFVAVWLVNTLTRHRISYRLDVVIADISELQFSASALHGPIDRLLSQVNVQLHCAEAAGTKTGVILSNGIELYADRVIAASRTRPPPWLEVTQLSRNNDGLVIVDRHHRSISHNNVFACGDMAANS